jgi:hypothetical protein
VDLAAQSSVLQSLPHLPAPLAILAEGVDGSGLLTKEELELAIASAKRGSCPGDDGLPYEVYRSFGDLLSPLLLRVYNRAFSSPSPGALTSLLVGTICPLPKPRQAHTDLSGFRPITLLNCDLKLVMAILTTRLQRPLNYLIDIMQSAFIHGRDISDNVRYHLGLKARFEELGLPAWLLHSDLNKAYDTVNRPCLLRAMCRMGLRDPGIVSWIRLLMDGTRATVRLNGACSDPFHIRDMSLPQGGAVSCPLWTIAGEVIVSYLSSLQHLCLGSFP